MGHKRKVLHVVTALSWRGGEQQVAYLIDELQDRISNIVLCSKGSEMERHCKEKGIDHLTQIKRGGFDLVYAREIKRICKEMEIDLCHLHDAHAHTFAVLASVLGNRTPLVLSRRVDFPIKQKLTSKFKYNHPAIKKILCVSEMIKEIAAPDIKDKSKLHTVYSGVDLDKFLPKNGKLRKELGIAGEVKLVGNTSALADHKDYFTFIDTAALLLEKNNALHFVIIGDGPMRDEVKSYASEKGLNSHLTFTGYRKDVPQILADLDIFLITSKTEGLGTSIIDAFACGVPVVATAAGGIPELVEDRKTGLLCPVKDTGCLAESILMLISDHKLQEELTQQANAKVQHFSKSAMANQTFKHYQDVWS